MASVREGGWGEFSGVWLENAAVRLFIPAGFGPRILWFGFQGGENLLAEVPQAVIAVEGEGDFSLRGGHRLWAAPESPERTYAADDQPVEIRSAAEGVELQQQVDRAGIEKSWALRLVGEKAEVVLQHRLANRNQGPVRLAPWAVTMLRPGGVGLLPLSRGAADEHGLGPDRRLLIWPYTDLDSPQLAITPDGVSVKAELREGALKVGAPNPAGWLAYRHQGILFVKRSAYLEGETYPDQGASHQIYCDPGTIELETLGPLVELAPGEQADHQETWQLSQENN